MARLDDFSHLEPQEKIFIARNRMSMLSNVLVDVIKLDEQKHVFVNSCFSRDWHTLKAVQLLSVTLENYEVAQVCRLWDQLDPAGFSLPTIASLLDGSDVRQELTVPGAATSIRTADEDFLKIFDEAVRETAQIGNYREHERLEHYRHKAIAHPIYSTQQERKRKIEDPLAQDIDFLVINAWRIMTVFGNALTLNLPDYQMEKIQIGRELESFYDSLTCSLPAR